MRPCLGFLGVQADTHRVCKDKSRAQARADPGIAELRAEIGVIKDELRQVKDSRADTSTSHGNSAGRMDAFTLEIILEPLPPHFKNPTLETYDGSTNPDDHLEGFRVLMILYGYSDALMCRTFQATLRGAARRWFSSHPPRLISSWEQLTIMFLARFISSRRCQKRVVSLMSLKQESGESLQSYIDRFKKEELEVRDLNPIVSVHVAINGLRPSSALKCSVAKTPPKTKLEFFKKAQKYIAAEEASARDNQEGAAECHDGPLKKKRKSGDQCPPDNNGGKDNKKPTTLAYRDYMSLNSTRTQILMQTREEKFMKWPMKLKRNPKRGNPTNYCKYHHGTGHNTDDCYDLKNEIESLIH
ncbi:PREDICTED: uncharacterized protein LOC104594970 [Nelumbo nucifera]|uniref:Uncharacterized protein LOC104594970 n=1 Tax=Nelumbo nucifera TaxID=4432 RepID=A0A1U7ZYS5_NELNU|nr:PREDICTED: uncharacterized protein LOC104594970 [Nelumbo nucifera]